MTDKIIISKCGARHHKNDVDMMEFIQLDDMVEFDLDKVSFDDSEPIIVEHVVDC